MVLINLPPSQQCRQELSSLGAVSGTHTYPSENICTWTQLTQCFSSSLLWTPFALKILFDIIHKHWRDFYLAPTFVQFLLNESQWHTNGDELFIGLKGSQSCFYSYWKFIRRPKSTKLITGASQKEPSQTQGCLLKSRCSPRWVPGNPQKPGLLFEVKWKSLSRVRLFVTPWTIQSMEFYRPEYWSG